MGTDREPTMHVETGTWPGLFVCNLCTNQEQGKGLNVTELI